MARSDILVVFTGGGGAGAGTMTGKLYEYMALRRPVLLVGPEGDASELVETSGAGVAARPDDWPGLLHAINEAIRMAADPDFVGASEAILARYDRRNLAEAWSQELESAVERRGAP
jgi:hypothetical protein